MVGIRQNLHGPPRERGGPPMYASPGYPGWESSGAFHQTHPAPSVKRSSRPLGPAYQSTGNRAWEPSECLLLAPPPAPYYFAVQPHPQTVYAPPFSQFPFPQFPISQFPISQFPVSQFPVSQFPVPQFPIQQQGNLHSGFGPLALPRLQVEQQGNSCTGQNLLAPPRYQFEQQTYVRREPRPTLPAYRVPQQGMPRKVPVPYKWKPLDETDSTVKERVEDPVQTSAKATSAPLIATAPEFIPFSAQKNEKQAQDQENLKSKSSFSLAAATTEKYAPVFAKKVVPVVSPEPLIISLKPDPNASVIQNLRAVAEYNRKYPNSARAQIYAQMPGPETVFPPISEPKPAPQNTKPNFLRSLQDPSLAAKIGLSISDPQTPCNSKRRTRQQPDLKIQSEGRRLVDVWFPNSSRPEEQSTTPMTDDSEDSDPYSPGPVPFDIMTLPIVKKPQITLNPAEAGKKLVDLWLPNVPHPKEERAICMHDGRENRESQNELADQRLPASSASPLVLPNKKANGGRHVQAYQKW